MDHALSQSAGERRGVGMHETRKAAKRLRYASEAIRPALGNPAKRLQRRLKKVQQLLGKYQDTVVSRPTLRELAGQAHLDDGNGFTYGLMHAAEANRPTRAERKLPARWQKTRKQEHRVA